jgi:hypothetical protein
MDATSALLPDNPPITCRINVSLLSWYYEFSVHGVAYR